MRGEINELLEGSKTKKRNFIETVELQIGLKNYDPQRDKRFSGTIKLPHVPRPRMSICILADAADIDRAKLIELGGSDHWMCTKLLLTRKVAYRVHVC